MKGVVKYSVVLVSLALVSLFAYLALSAPAAAQTGSNWVVEGSTVFADVPNKGRISQTPHTLTDFSNQPILKFTSYFDTEQCFDIAFGFDTSKVKPVAAEYYNPYFVNETKTFKCSEPYWYNSTANHFWCWYNVSITDNTTGDAAEYKDVLIYDHDFESYDLGTGIASWNEAKYVEYTDVSDRFEKIDYDLNGKNIWYLIQDIHFMPNETKTIRPTIAVIPSLGENSGKYDIIVKRCSDTIA